MALSIDVKGSTKISQELDPVNNANIISLFAKEIAQIVSFFNVFVLKYLVVGLIAYFPEPDIETP